MIILWELLYEKYCNHYRHYRHGFVCLALHQGDGSYRGQYRLYNAPSISLVDGILIIAGIGIYVLER